METVTAWNLSTTPAEISMNKSANECSEVGITSKYFVKIKSKQHLIVGIKIELESP
jgi:hypothetical protein